MTQYVTCDWWRVIEIFFSNADDLILEILYKSKVGTVLRSKCVCRHWCDLISQPEFAKNHFDSAPKTEKLLWRTGMIPHFRTIDFNKSLNDDSAYKILSPCFLGPQLVYYDMYIWGSCGSFILVGISRTFYVWNPSTDYKKQIPNSFTMRYTSNASNDTWFHVGFGYDRNTEDYLVVLLWWDDYIKFAEYYSVSENAWNRVYTDSPYVSRHAFWGTFFENAIHWLVFPFDADMEIVLCFDLAERNFRDILLPNNIDYTNSPSFKLRVLGGLLSLCNFCGTDNGQSMDQTLEIWSMKEYGDHTSWSKMITLNFCDTPSCSIVSPVCYTESGDIFGNNRAALLVKWNEDGQVQEQKSHELSFFQQLVVYRESLFSI
ncbi:unnamed protein product [Sphenostylis stenocarpa]|uniref:F-box associated beta-propeller type 3 domain-containing protein n=1 Tax=Sphenostylis stenocarpa TaxID=92480 RepID=A0AA87B8J3_9FABA|nr:unnamed protein product [Sphenostylis stenocarpa]